MKKILYIVSANSGKMKLSFLLFILINIFSPANAQVKIDNDIIKYFFGDWVGEGMFSNGKKIAANVTFKLSLDSCWLINTHQDIPPGTYTAVSAWGIETSGKWVNNRISNFDGYQQLTSNGWKPSEISFTAKPTKYQNKIFFQHFIYQEISHDQFKMTYEVSYDGVAWKEGDHLIFKRTIKN